jgi:oligosaccharide repeat unit polymerase
VNRAQQVALGAGALSVGTGMISWPGAPLPVAASGSLVLLALSAWLMQRVVRVFDLQQMTIPGFWYLTFLATMYLPSLLIVFARASPEPLNPVGYPFRIYAGPHLALLLFAVNSILITVPLGIALAEGLLRFRADEIRDYFAARVDEERDHQARMAAYALVIAAALAASALYIIDVASRVGTVPLLELFRLHGTSLAQLRIGSLVALDSPRRYLYAIVIGTVYPLLTAATLGHALHTRTRGWLLLFFCTLSAGAFSAAVSTARGDVAVILTVSFALWYLYLGGLVKRKFLLFALAAVSVFPIVVSIAMYRIGVLDALRIIGIRLFYTPAYVQYLYFQVVPAQLPWLHGRTSPTLAWLTGQRYFNMQAHVMRIPYPHAAAHTMTSGPFIGDFYVNFGIPGVLAGGVLAGVIMGAIQVWLVRRPKTVTNLAVYAFLLYAFWTLSVKPLPVVLWSGGVFFALLTAWVLVAVETAIGGARSFVPAPSGDVQSETPGGNGLSSGLDSEVGRIRAVYAGYRADPGTLAKWDPRNPGNVLMREEFHRGMLAFLAQGKVQLGEARILDVGCGSGATLRWLARRGAQSNRLYGVDLREDQIALARANDLGMNLVCGDARQLSFPNQYFDVAICNNLFGSILDRGIADSVATEIRRVVKPRGLIIWCDGRYRNPGNSNVRGYSFREIQSCFPGCRIELRSITVLPPLARRLGRFTSWLYPVLARIPLLRVRYLGTIRPGPSG